MRTLLLGVALCSLLSMSACGGRKPFRVEGAETPEMIAAQLDKASSLVRDAQRQELAGHESAAKAKYTEAIGVYRELPVAWNNLGRILMREGSNLQAADAFKTAAEYSPTDPRPLHNLGTLWESLGYLDDAQRWYGEALVRDDNYLPSLRRSLIVEEIRNKPDAETLDRIKRGLMLEKDPWWIERFKRARLRFEDLIASRQADAMTSTTSSAAGQGGPVMMPRREAQPAQPQTAPPAAPTPAPVPVPAPESVNEPTYTPTQPTPK